MSVNTAARNLPFEDECWLVGRRLCGVVRSELLLLNWSCGLWDQLYCELETLWYMVGAGLWLFLWLFDTPEGPLHMASVSGLRHKPTKSIWTFLYLPQIAGLISWSGSSFLWGTRGIRLDSQKFVSFVSFGLYCVASHDFTCTIWWVYPALLDRIWSPPLAIRIVLRINGHIAPNFHSGTESDS